MKTLTVTCLNPEFDPIQCDQISWQQVQQNLHGPGVLLLKLEAEHFQPEFFS